MLALLQAFLKITLRRLGPEHLPDSGFLLGVAGVAYGAMQFLVALPFFAGLGGALLRSVAVDLLLLSGCLWGLLRLAGKPGRYRQTLTALWGTGALLSVAIWPFSWLGAGAPQEAPSALASAGVIGVVLWSVVVNAHILARALSVPFVLGLAAAIGYFLLNYLVILQVSPAPA